MVLLLLIIYVVYLNAYEYRPSFLPHLFSIPNDPGFDNMFLEIVKSVPNVSNDFIFPKVLASPFHLSTLMIILEDEIQSIQQRNRQYIEDYERRNFLSLALNSPVYAAIRISPDFKGN